MTSRTATVLALVSLLALTLVSAGYLVFGVLKVEPKRESMTVRVEMPSSGGLMVNSDVTIRGLPIGKVTDIAVTPAGLEATLDLDGSHSVPRTAMFHVANLSAAGEQFMDIRPDTATGPYLAGGAVIPTDQVVVSASVSEMLEQVDALTRQLNPGDIDGLMKTLDGAIDGQGRNIETLLQSETLFAQTVRDKLDTITNLYVNSERFGQWIRGYGPKLTDLAPDITQVRIDLPHLIHSLQVYSFTGEKVWDDPLGPLITHIDKYLSPLVPDLALISTVLRPATAPLRPLRVNVGSIFDLLDSVFPGNGAARVTVEPPR